MALVRDGLISVKTPQFDKVICPVDLVAGEYEGAPQVGLILRAVLLVTPS